MTGMDVPVRAQWLRALLCELNRLMAHMVFLTPLSPAAAAYREGVQALMEEASGGRIHFMFNRIGGLREDVPAGWTGRVAAFLSTVDVSALDVDFSPLEGLGVLPLADALAYGVTGPIGRASGVDLDLRRDDPLPAYRSLEFTPVVRTEGDAAARVRCLLDEVRLSLTLARSCVDNLPSGPVNVRLPKAIKAPEGSVYTRVEAPLGTSGVHLSSRGEKTPWRLKLRTPSFNNVQALSALLPGTSVDDLPAVLSSFAVVVGDIDK